MRRFIKILLIGLYFLTAVFWIDCHVSVLLFPKFFDHDQSVYYGLLICQLFFSALQHLAIVIAYKYSLFKYESFKRLSKTEIVISLITVVYLLICRFFEHLGLFSLSTLVLYWEGISGWVTIISLIEFAVVRTLTLKYL